MRTPAIVAGVLMLSLAPASPAHAEICGGSGGAAAPVCAVVVGEDDGSGWGGATLDPTYVPKLPSVAQLSTIRAKLQIEAQTEPQTVQLLALGATGASSADPDAIAEVPGYSAPCADYCGRPPQSDPAPSSAKVRMGFNKQKYTNYCAPATTQNILYGIKGVTYSQEDLAAPGALNTAPPNSANGTDPRRIAPLLNANQQANTYQALTPADVGSPTRLFNKIVVNVYRYRVGTGFTGDPAKFPWSQRKESVQTLSHEIGIYGYQSSGGGILLVSEPANATRQQFKSTAAWTAMSSDHRTGGILSW